ncbi:MAG: hypothetical protein KBT49_03180 [Bacteroidetes bacterium]|nr:hypothetical protein [Candidatus Colenecus caballi]
MKKICITFLAAMFLAAPAFAQNNGWFVSLGGGVNINQEGYRHDGGYGVAPALSVGAGMWFSPDLGVKLGYDGMKLKNDKFFKDGVITMSFPHLCSGICQIPFQVMMKAVW